MTSRNRRALGALALAAILGAGACSSSGSSKASDKSSSTESSSSVSSSSSASASSSSSTSSGKLLTLGDLGNGPFTQGTWKQSHDPFPCTPNAGDPDVSYAPASVDGAVFESATPQAQLTEEVRTYPGADLTKSVMDAVTKGFDCSTATVSGVTLTIAAPVDVTSDVGADTAKAWSVKGGGQSVTFVVAQKGSTIVALQFVAVDGADTSTLPNPQTLSKTAVTKATS